MHFTDRLVEKIEAKKSCICLGFDPILKRVPSPIINLVTNEYGFTFEAAAQAYLEFGKVIISSVADLVPVVKFQLAYFEQLGFQGIKVFEELVRFAESEGLLVIADAKRGDIDSTAEAYAQAFLGEVDLFGTKESVFGADAVTVNPYMGYDTIKPFVKVAKKLGKGVFVLVKTSNSSSADLQDRTIDSSGLKLSEMVGHFVDSWGADEVGACGYSAVGAVVGGTFAKELKTLRKLMPNNFFLVPGFGAQGAQVEDLKLAFDENGLGAIINASRSINYAYESLAGFDERTFGEAARAAVLEMQSQLG